MADNPILLAHVDVRIEICVESRSGLLQVTSHNALNERHLRLREFMRAYMGKAAWEYVDEQNRAQWENDLRSAFPGDDATVVVADAEKAEVHFKVVCPCAEHERVQLKAYYVPLRSDTPAEPETEHEMTMAELERLAKQILGAGGDWTAHDRLMRVHRVYVALDGDDASIEISHKKKSEAIRLAAVALRSWRAAG